MFGPLTLPIGVFEMKTIFKLAKQVALKKSYGFFAKFSTLIFAQFSIQLPESFHALREDLYVSKLLDDKSTI